MTKSQSKRLVHSCEVTLSSTDPNTITTFIRKVLNETVGQSTMWLSGVKVTSKLTETSEVVNVGTISKEIWHDC
jgi:hypothetical protein